MSRNVVRNQNSLVPSSAHSEDSSGRVPPVKKDQSLFSFLPLGTESQRVVFEIYQELDSDWGMDIGLAIF